MEAGDASVPRVFECLNRALRQSRAASVQCLRLSTESDGPYGGGLSGLAQRKRGRETNRLGGREVAKEARDRRRRGGRRRKGATKARREEGRRGSGDLVQGLEPLVQIHLIDIAADEGKEREGERIRGEDRSVAGGGVGRGGVGRGGVGGGW